MLSSKQHRVTARLPWPGDPCTLPPLVTGAWGRLDRLRVADAVYVELASRLGLQVLTSDARLARASDLAVLVE